jgi:hypothetical protein
VESGVGYVKGNFWPSARFVDLEDLNREAQAWVDTVADVRIHGTTKERPADRLAEERPRLRPVPGPERLAPFLRDRRKVGRDGYVQWEKAAYGVSWRWVGKEVQVQAEGTVVEIWAGEQRLAVHPRATRPGQRSTLPGQWEGLPSGDGRPRKEARAVQVSSIEVEQRSLAEYQLLVGRGAASETYSISGRLGEIGSQT